MQFQRYAHSSSQSAVISHAAIEFQAGSDYLTEEARLFVISADPKHMGNYFIETKVTQRREKSLEEIKNLSGNMKAGEYLNMALEQSYILAQTELYAMKLVVDGKHFENDNSVPIPDDVLNVKLNSADAVLGDEYKIAKAWLIMFSEEYLTKKQVVSELKSKAMEEILDYSDELLYSSYNRLKNDFIKMVLCIGLIFVFNLTLFIVIICYVIVPLYNHIRNIRSGKKLGKTHIREFDILSDTYNEMIDKNAAHEKLLKQKAEHDELTGILNRTAFNQITDSYRENGSKLALLLIDVDFFKTVNDTYGHITGDKVLQKVAHSLADNFGEGNYVLRVGGDEFVVIFAGCIPDEDLTRNLISSKISAAMAALTVPSELPEITLSCGIALSSNGYSDTLYNQADSALYEVKRNGRNGFKFYGEM